MTPSEQCRSAGLDSLAELSRITGESETNLINWHHGKGKNSAVYQTRFRLILAGAVDEKRNRVDCKNRQKSKNKCTIRLIIINQFNEQMLVISRAIPRVNDKVCVIFPSAKDGDSYPIVSKVQFWPNQYQLKQLAGNFNVEEIEAIVNVVS
jgi:hypothetical protein